MEIYKFIRCCAVCGKYYPPTDWLCSYCWRNLEEGYLSSKDVYRVEKNLPHLRLFDWHEQNHLLIQPFIESLKQGGPFFIFKRMGLEIFSRFIHRFLWGKHEKVIFVPAPRRNPFQEDHAFLLAKSLSFYFGGEVKDSLIKDDPKSFQKGKTRKERSEISFTNTYSAKKNEVIVFVDDILTTGSTAKAAYKAFNRPSQFFVFTLAWKKPPAPSFLED